MAEYDPLILRDQLRGQIDHARIVRDAGNEDQALFVLIEFLEDVIEDINEWENFDA